jgi:hypothetical protein
LLPSQIKFVVLRIKLSWFSPVTGLKLQAVTSTELKAAAIGNAVCRQNILKPHVISFTTGQTA